MNYVEPKILSKIRDDLRNPKCEGFFLESDGNEMTVRRINRWQFDMTTESWRGNINTYTKVNSAYIENMVEEWLMIDDHCTYIPYNPIKALVFQQTSNKTIYFHDCEKFIEYLCPNMCKPLLKGFKLHVDGVDDYVVQKHWNGIEWKVNDKVTDFVGVLRMTREKLTEDHMWEYIEF